MVNTVLSRLPMLLVLALTACAIRTPRRTATVQDAVLPVVAVTQFENRSGFSGQWNLGSGMADLLIAELMDTGRFTVLERQDIGGVVGEIRLQDQALFRREGRVETGRLKNARYQIRGTITDFSQVRGGGFWVGVRRLFFRGSGATARVAMTLTVVEVETGEILASVPAAGTATARAAFAEVSYKGVSFGGDSFSRTPLGSATSRAIRSGVRQLVRLIPRETWQAMIAEQLDRGRVMVNGGIRHGLEAGQVFRVLGPARVVTDPATGDVLARLPGPELGRIRLRETQPSYSVAEVLGGGPFPRGARLEAVAPPPPSP